jgi:hypothetical protein
MLGYWSFDASIMVVGVSLLKGFYVLSLQLSLKKRVQSKFNASAIFFAVITLGFLDPFSICV